MSSPSRIQVLPDSLINKIAAGEVVERPASAVKELVENAIDAGSRRIEVEIEAGGRALLRVVDDGCGMNREEALLALQRHATSKIRTDADLFAIRSLGFRGEAVPSIAQVSRFEVRTGEPGEAVGTRVVVDGGEVLRVEDAPNPGGTEIVVRRLFFNTPVRLKFLRTPRTEVAHVADVLNRTALAHPATAFRFVSDGRVLLDAPSVETLGERVAAVLGKAVAASMHPVGAEGEGVRLEGLISDPSLHRSGRGGLYLFVNGRYVVDRTVLGAVLSAYRPHLPPGRYPVVTLFVDVPPDRVDVNVHPAKTEVRFVDGSQVYRFVSSVLAGAVGELLGEAPSLGHGPLFDGPAPPRPPVRRSVVPLPPLSPPVRGRLMDSAPRPEAPPPPDPLPEVSPPPIERGPRPDGEPGEAALLGQLAGGLAVGRVDGDLVLVDLPAARRALLEAGLRGERDEPGARPERLLVPALLDLPAARVRRLASRAPALEVLGIEVSEFGADTLAVHSLPAAFPRELLASLVDALLDELDRAPDAAAARLAAVVAEGAARALPEPDAAELRRLVRLAPGLAPPAARRLPAAELRRLLRRG